MKNYGPCVVMRPRKGGLVKFRFEVRRNRPEGWPATRTILVNGRDGVRLADMTPQMEAEVDRQAEALFRQLGQLRALEAAELPRPPKIERSWEELIALRREHSNWQGLKPASRATYASTQKRIVQLLGWDPALAPSTILESQIDRIFLKRVLSPHRRKALYLETRRLLEKAVRENWRDPALTLNYSCALPASELRVWTADDLRCAVTQAITDGERGLARLLLTQWEVGQRLQSVRFFRYGYQYENGCFFYKCVKTGREIRIELKNPRARAVLDATYEHGAYMFPSAVDGKPFTGPQLTKAFTRLRRQLKGFDPKLQLRQLRHTVVLELALAGCNIPEIASITSHDLATVHHTLKHYLAKDSDLADRAMEKRERRRLEQVSGLSGEVIVDGARRIYIGDLPKAETPQGPPVTKGRPGKAFDEER